MHPAQLPIDELLADCETRRGRRSGPGGQHRNKVETAVTLTHTVTGIQGDASERRSQAENRKVAIFRLRVNLALEHRAEAVPLSELWASRTKNGKLTVSRSHDDFPALLAEALDRLAVASWDDSEAAKSLGISRSQLLRFLKVEPRALRQLNDSRAEQGKKPLR